MPAVIMPRHANSAQDKRIFRMSHDIPVPNYVYGKGEEDDDWMRRHPENYRVTSQLEVMKSDFTEAKNSVAKGIRAVTRKLLGKKDED
jgi:hypothetical protein